MGERIIRIAISAFFLVMIFFIFSGIYKSCKNKSTTDTTKAETATDALESNDASLEEYAEEYFEDGYNESEDSEEYTSYGASDTQEFDDDLFDEPEDNTPSTSNTTSSYDPEPEPEPTPARAISSNTTGKYIAVAGNYLIIDNARNMVKKLQRIGYDDAEYFTFDGSEYYTVGAVRTNDYDSVQSSARDLRQRGIDNYIHTVR